jgi:molybdate transport system substrate-binding protein
MLLFMPLFFLFITALPLRAEQALVAVAANFLKPAEVLAALYEIDSGHEIQLAGGSTGQHYAQILHGAPYDVFLAADDQRPRLLEEQGLAQGRFTYAVGRLAVFSADQDFPVDQGLEALKDAGFVAIANPALAPYGRAAQEVLETAGLSEHLQGQLVQGQNVGQAFGMVASGNTRVGLVALSMAQEAEGVFAVVPDDLHGPILQDAVLLNHGKGNLAAEGFLAYLASDAALTVLEDYGYARP